MEIGSLATATATARITAHAAAFSRSRAEEADQHSGNRLFVLGMGFVGRFVARELNKESWVASGTSRSAKKVEKLSRSGFDVCLFDANSPDALDTITKQGPLSESQKMRTSKRYTSRVHVEDFCQALRANIRRPSSGRVYNIVDDDPAPREEVFAYTLDLVERKWPGLIKRSLSIQVAESVVKKGNSEGEKRVSNARMKNELGVQLLHPSYRSGLQGIVDQMEHPFQFTPL